MQLEDEKVTTPFDAGVDWLVLGEDAAPEEDEPFAGFVEEHVEALLRFAVAAGRQPERAQGLVAGALATAYRRWRDIREGEERPLVEVAGIVARRLSRLQEHQAEVAARHDAWRAGWQARPEGVGSDTDDLGPGAVHALVAELHVRLDALTHPGGGRAAAHDPVRSALDRMMPDDRLAGALHEMLGLDEREVGAALRLPWLHAVARIARAEARAPELLAEVGIKATLGEALARLGTAATEPPPAPRLTGRARRRARWTAVGCGAAVAAVVGLLGVSLPSITAPAAPPVPAAVAPATSLVVPPFFAVSAGPAVTRPPCPAFPAEPAHPIYHGPPVTAAMLLSPDDFAVPGADWARLSGPYVPALPTGVVDGVDPVLPYSQAVALADTLMTVRGPTDGNNDEPTSVVQQLLVRYDRNTGALAARRIARQLECHDSEHVVRLIQHQDGKTITIRAYAQALIVPGAKTRRIDSWLVLVRSGDVITFLRVRGALAADASAAGSAALAAAALSRLEGHGSAPFS